MRLVFGAAAIGDLLEQHQGAIQAVLVAPGQPRGEDESLLRRAERAGIPVREVSAETLRRHAGSRSTGHLAAEVKVATPLELEDLVSEIEGRPNLVVALDGVTDPHNLGAILRSVAAFGGTAVILPRHGAAPLNDAAVRASAGAVALVPVLRVVNLARGLRQLAGAGFWSVALGAGQPEPLWSKDLTVPLVLVLGAEGTGIRPGVERACDMRVGLPLSGPIGSLNVSVAAGIALHEVTRQRGLGYPAPMSDHSG
jgi:23S rRNA (guanosine2251-2'-O)-methyltransferase